MAQSNKTAPKAAEQATSSENRGFAGRVIEAQKSLIDFQKTTFDRSYGFVNNLQERQEDAVTSWLERSDRIPSEFRQLAETWIGARRTGRETYRDSVEKSFALVHEYFDGLATKQASV